MKLISLDKLLGVRPIEIVEVFRRFIGKVVTKFKKKNILRATGCLQLRAGQNSGSEASFYAVYDIFNNEKTEEVLMVHPSNAFNAIHWTVFLHNKKILCPSVPTYINNRYLSAKDLYIQSG